MPPSSGPTCWPTRSRGLGADAAATPDPALIAGLTPPDDAAAYRVSDDLAIIGTLDFFPPLVDDPRTFGEIAAANALSDVFAMGGRVLFALSIAAFPEDLPRDVLAEIFAGASAKVREAGGTLAGGHTIRDPEPKYGLAVIGAGHPDRLLRKGGAQPGDVLLLTKRLGTGLLVSGHRQGKTGRERPRGGRSTGCARSTAPRRRCSSSAACGARPTSPGSGCSGTVSRWRAPPGPGSCSTPTRCRRFRARSELASDGVETDGAAHNRRFVAPSLTVANVVRPEIVTLAHDPQTSGGLLAAVAPAAVEDTIRALNAVGVQAWRVGRVEAGEPAIALA